MPAEQLSTFTMLACFDPSDNRVLGLRGKITGSIDSFADLDPEPLHEFDIELFEYQNDNGFQLGYAIPSTLDFFRIVSSDPPKSSHRNEEVKDLMLAKQRHLLSDATGRLIIMKEFAGETTDDDTFWRAVQADIVPRVVTRAPKEKPFPGVNMKFLDATPSLAEPSNWTATHPVLQSMSRSDLEYAHNFLGDTEPWREAKFGRTAKGHLAWMPAKTELTDSICLFGGASTFHVIRPDPDSSGRWKIIGPAYVQGLMDGEAAPNQYSEDDFLWIS